MDTTKLKKDETVVVAIKDDKVTNTGYFNEIIVDGKGKTYVRFSPTHVSVSKHRGILLRPIEEVRVATDEEITLFYN